MRWVFSNPSSLVFGKVSPQHLISSQKQRGKPLPRKTHPNFSLRSPQHTQKTPRVLVGPHTYGIIPLSSVPSLLFALCIPCLVSSFSRTKGMFSPQILKMMKKAYMSSVNQTDHLWFWNDRGCVDNFKTAKSCKIPLTPNKNIIFLVQAMISASNKIPWKHSWFELMSYLGKFWRIFLVYPKQRVFCEGAFYIVNILYVPPTTFYFCCWMSAVESPVWAAKVIAPSFVRCENQGSWSSLSGM